MNSTCRYLGKTIACRDMPQTQWIVQGFIHRDNRNDLLLVNQSNSADAAFMPYALFLDAIEAGIFREQEGALPLSEGVA